VGSYNEFSKHLHFVSLSGQVKVALWTFPVIALVLPRALVPPALLGEQRKQGDAAAE